MTLSRIFNGNPKPSLDLAVYDTESLQGFHDKMEEAILIVSQSDYAREIARAAIDADYVFVVEDKPQGETPEEYKNRERGSVDHRQKIIFVRKEDDTEMLALTIFHELAHVSQYVTCGIRVEGLEDNPVTLLQKLLMMEADARAQEIAFALSLKKSSPGLLEKAAAKAESKRVDDLVTGIKDDDDIERIMAERFKIYFLAVHMRRGREDAVLSMMEKLDEKTLSDEKNFCAVLTGNELAARLDRHGLPYLTKNSECDDDFFRAISQDGFQRLERLEAVRRQNPKAAEQPTWDCPVYKTGENKPAAYRSQKP